MCSTEPTRQHINRSVALPNGWSSMYLAVDCALSGPLKAQAGACYIHSTGFTGQHTDQGAALSVDLSQHHLGSSPSPVCHC